MMIFRLALRNLIRHARRSALTLAAITVGFSLVAWTINLQAGSYEDMINSGISQQAGHVVLEAPGYTKDPKVETRFGHLESLMTTVQTAVPDATLNPKLMIQGLLTSSSGGVGAAMVAGLPEVEAEVGEFDEHLIAGQWLASDDLKGIILGSGLADRLELKVGNKVVWMGQYGDEDATSKLFRVRGIVELGVPTIDGNVAFAHLKAGQELLGAPDEANRLSVHLKEGRHWEEAVAAVRGVVKREDVVVLSWKQALPTMAELIDMDRLSGDFTLFILGIIVAMGVLNTVLMSAMERTREFGVLLAIGLKSRQVGALILTEGLLLGVVGTLLGWAVGVALTWPTVEYGIDMTGAMGGESFDQGGIAVSAVLHAAWDWFRMSKFALGSVLLTTSAALYPAWYVTRLKPVEAMHHV